MGVLLEVQMTKKEFIQANIIVTYERLLKTEPVTALTMSIAVRQLEKAYDQLTSLGYGAATKITSTMQQQATINTDPTVLLDNGLHKNKSIEYWTAKLKEARGNKNSDCQDLVYLRNALSSAETSKMMGFGFYK